MFKPEGARVPIYDLEGLEYGDWKVVELSSPRPVLWLCRCKCGTERLKGAREIIHNMKRGDNSCGCHRRERFAANAKAYQQKSDKTVHGDAKQRGKARLYTIWAGMRRRCSDPNDQDYPAYGGRGITVYSGWVDYVSFKKWALDNGYNKNLSLDRIDPFGNYEPKNCRWANANVQASNKRKRASSGVTGVTATRGGYNVSLTVSGKLHQKWVKTLEEAAAYRQSLERKYLSPDSCDIIERLNRGGR